MLAQDYIAPLCLFIFTNIYFDMIYKYLSLYALQILLLIWFINAFLLGLIVNFKLFQILIWCHRYIQIRKWRSAERESRNKDLFIYFPVEAKTKYILLLVIVAINSIPSPSACSHYLALRPHIHHSHDRSQANWNFLGINLVMKSKVNRN